MLDSGYRLHRLDADRLQFDAALNTAMMLSYVALKHNDSVALFTFGNDERWIQPRKGIHSLNALMNQIYDVQSAPVPSSPAAALEQVLARLHKRSLIILISNFREEDNETLSWVLPRIQRQHILLMASLREKEAEQCALQKPATVQEAMVQAAAFTYLQDRKNLYAAWEHQGLLCLDSTAEQLSSAVINQYLDLKGAGTL